MVKLPKFSLDRQVLADIPFIKWVYASFVFNLVVILLVLAIQKWLPPQVPLFYGMAEGEGQLAKSILLPIPSLAAIGISLANILISLSIKDLFIKKALIVAGLGVTFLATITVFKIVFLLGSF